MLRREIHGAPQYVVFSCLFVPRPSQTQPSVFLSTLFSDTLSICFSLHVTGHAASYYYDDEKKAGTVALLEDMETSGGLLRTLK